MPSFALNRWVDFRSEVLPVGHFVIRDHPPLLLGLIVKRLLLGLDVLSSNAHT